MINTDYRNSNTSFGTKLSPETYTKLKNNVSKDLNHCIDICCNRIEEWGEHDSVISLGTDYHSKAGTSHFIISNKRLGKKTAKLSFDKKDNELLSALISITKDMIISAEKYIRNSGS